MGPWRSCWNGTTSALQLEELLLRRGVEFHVCTIKKGPIRRKSGNLFNDPHKYYNIREISEWTASMSMLKVNLIWSHSIRVLRSAYEDFCWPSSIKLYMNISISSCIAFLKIFYNFFVSHTSLKVVILNDVIVVFSTIAYIPQMKIILITVLFQRRYRSLMILFCF